VIVKYNYLAMSIIVSSFGKFLFILTMIWDYHIGFLTGIDLFVLTSNVVAIKVFLDTSNVRAVTIVAIAFGLKVFFQFFCAIFDKNALLCIV